MSGNGTVETTRILRGICLWAEKHSRIVWMACQNDPASNHKSLATSQRLGSVCMNDQSHPMQIIGCPP